MIRLNIGCGKHNLGKDWIHIDGESYPHVKYHDVTQLPFEDNSVDLIYSSHLIDYFDRHEFKEILLEWRRVLKEGGKIQLVVSDFNVIAGLKLLGVSLKDMEMTLFGRMKLRENLIYHKTCWNREELSRLLKSSGFRRVRSFNKRHILLSLGTIFLKRILFSLSPRKRGQIMSLYLEGEKK